MLLPPEQRRVIIRTNAILNTLPLGFHQIDLIVKSSPFWGDEICRDVRACALGRMYACVCIYANTGKIPYAPSGRHYFSELDLAHD